MIVRNRGLKRSGSSFLEIQVSLILLGVALAGLCPLMVMQSRILRRIESGDLANASGQVVQGSRIVDGDIYGSFIPPTFFLHPNPDPWIRRLGVAATIGTTAPTQIDAIFLQDDAGTTPIGWLAEANDPSIAYLGFDQFRPATAAISVPFTWPSLVAKTPGYYRVLATWPMKLTNTKSAAYSITRIPALGLPADFAATVVDQTRSPMGTSWNSWTWQDLGLSVWLDAGDQLQVTLDTTAQSRLAADAVAIVRTTTVNAVTIASPLTTSNGSSSVSANIGGSP